MSYFSQFPPIDYQLSPSFNSTRRVVNLTAAVKMLEQFNVQTTNLFVDYIIKDGERPDTLADRVYGASSLHWLILLSNQVVNPFFEWPLSRMELDDYVDATYRGQVFYFDCRPNTIRFAKNGTETMLSSADSHFVVGETVTQGNTTCTVQSWDSTFRRLVVDDADGTLSAGIAVTSVNSNGDTFTATPMKYVIQHPDSLHHFEDDLGNWMDPYGYINPTLYADGKIYSPESYYLFNGGAPTPSTSNNFPLNRYINGNDFSNAVTNRDYEERVNDAKRRIKILRTEYVDTMVQQLGTAFV